MAKLTTRAMLCLSSLAILSCGKQGEEPTGDLSARQAVQSGLVGRDVAVSRSGAVAKAYPMSVAPLTWVARDKLVAGDAAATDDFGGSVALSGELALVGSRGDDDAGSRSGAAYVFVRNAGGWIQEQKLVASDAAATDHFGSSVALSGNRALVGAGGEHFGWGSGSAYVFLRSASSWSEEQKLVASDAAATDYFGSSVALSGNRALVGAWGDDDVEEGSGSAYVFLRSASSWSEEQKLVASDAAATDSFGFSVALSGNRALMGSNGDDDAGEGSGSAYVFLRSASIWSEEQKLVASDAAATDYFGSSVALSGNRALMGSYGDDDAGEGSGSAYVFLRSASIWSEEQKLVASDAAATDSFGFSVALSGNRALMGSYGDDDAGEGSGSAYVFLRSASIWSEEQKLVASDAAATDSFGSSVALSADHLLMGSPRDDDAGASTGSAYVFIHLLVDGEVCNADEACASAHCANGFCCNRACDGPCETCGQATVEGACMLLGRSSTPTSDCSGHLCDGERSECRDSCRGDAECASSHHCRGEVVCATRDVDGAACVRDEACQSGHCVAGICCAQACDQGCGSCAIDGFEGTCAPLPDGNSGTPICVPYLCGGSDIACPARCASHRDCALGNHCADDRCQPDAPLGAACTEASSCAQGHCTDGVCCAAPSCGGYRCGSVGECKDACTSSAQCLLGFACNSSAACEAIPDASITTGEGCACAAVGVRSPLRWGLAWLAAMGLFGCQRVRGTGDPRLRQRAGGRRW